VCVDRHVRASPETLKALKKLRKKVKQCTKIQEKLDQGLRVEVNEVQKLNQLNDFKQQIAVLETQVSSGKAMDNQGFQKVQQRRR
jgi:DNA-directed RNA polymerase alpha subunit